MAASGTLTLGRLAVTTTRAHPPAPLVDGASLTEDPLDGDRSWGGLALRLPGTTFALVVGWQDARVPDPQRLGRRRRPLRPVKHDLDAGLYLVDKETPR